jgi:uncharacterized protein (TIGR03083 family)
MKPVGTPLAFSSPEFIAAIRLHAATFLAAAKAAGLETEVTTCPGWSVRDLLAHTGAVYRHKETTIRGNYSDRPAPRPEVPDDAGFDWFEQSLDGMLSALEDADLSLPSWTWCPHQHNADWWARRMAHETLIHAADALTASGQSPKAEASLAIDGVDEILDEMMIGGPSWGTIEPTEGTIRLRAGDRVWDLQTARFSGRSPKTGKTHHLGKVMYAAQGEPDAVISTDPATLNYWLWGRATLPPFSISGDSELVDRLRSIAAESTG